MRALRLSPISAVAPVLLSMPRRHEQHANPRDSLRVDPELGVYGLESALASVPIAKEAPDPRARFLGNRTSFGQGHIRGHNLHESRSN